MSTEQFEYLKQLGKGIMFGLGLIVGLLVLMLIGNVH